MDEHPLWRRLLAELLGSAFLAAIVIGSGIAAIGVIKALYPKLTPAETAEVIVPHHAASPSTPPERHHVSGHPVMPTPPVLSKESP